MAHSTQNGRFDYENLKKKFDRKSNSRVISAQGSKFARTLPGSRINFWSNFLHESIEEVNMLGGFSRQGSSTFGWPAGSLIVEPKKLQSETLLPRHHNSFLKNLRRRIFFMGQLWTAPAGQPKVLEPCIKNPPGILTCFIDSCKKNGQKLILEPGSVRANFEL